MNYKNYFDLRNDIFNNLPKLQQNNYDLIVGIPRSGMIPAYMISLFLNLHCTDITAFNNNVKLTNGTTRNIYKDISYPWDAKHILVIDDSIMSGKSMTSSLQKIPSHYTGKVSTVAIYSSRRRRNDVDYFFKYVPEPRVFEWNIFHCPIISKSCIDIDGVLCIDPTDEQNDDGEKYMDFLQNTKPQIIPSYIIDSIVTNRLEKYRSETEIWLKKNKIRYKSLIMLNLESKEDRIRLKINSSHKAQYYANTDLNFFIESDPYQAETISIMTGKSVYCTGDNHLYEPSSMKKIYKNTFAYRTLINRYALYLPNFIRKPLVFVYRKLQQ